jgi:hypothetical protein
MDNLTFRFVRPHGFIVAIGKIWLWSLERNHAICSGHHRLRVELSFGRREQSLKLS